MDDAEECGGYRIIGWEEVETDDGRLICEGALTWGAPVSILAYADIDSSPVVGWSRVGEAVGITRHGRAIVAETRYDVAVHWRRPFALSMTLADASMATSTNQPNDGSLDWPGVLIIERGTISALHVIGWDQRAWVGHARREFGHRGR